MPGNHETGGSVLVLAYKTFKLSRGLVPFTRTASNRLAAISLAPPFALITRAVGVRINHSRLLVNQIAVSISHRALTRRESNNGAIHSTVFFGPRRPFHQQYAKV